MGTIILVSVLVGVMVWMAVAMARARPTTAGRQSSAVSDPVRDYVGQLGPGHYLIVAIDLRGHSKTASASTDLCLTGS